MEQESARGGKGLWRIKVLLQGYVQVSLKRFNATRSTVKMFMIINQSRDVQMSVIFDEMKNKK